MVTNQILQRTIDGLSKHSDASFVIYDPEGSVLASTYDDNDKYRDTAVSFLEGGEPSKSAKGYRLRRFEADGDMPFGIVTVGDAAGTEMMDNILNVVLEELSVAYREQLDRDNFIKNLLLDNMLLVDIYNRAKKLHLEVVQPRVVMIVETGERTEGDEMDRIKVLFNGRSHDFVTAVDENSVIIVMELDPDYDDKEITDAAQSILDAFSDRENNKMRVAIGTTVNEIKEVSRSYKEAAMALDVGKIFFPDHYIIAYSVLGIGRLIYQLPIPLCKMFIGEIFEKKSPEDFDEETLITISKFFENSLNVSETSRQLYIHRNTLVYRLDKIQKSTGLDLRVFEDAITFKIAMMVVDYMKYMEGGKF